MRSSSHGSDETTRPANVEHDRHELDAARDMANSMQTVADAYGKALVSLGWDPEEESAEAFANGLWSAFSEMRSTLIELSNVLPDVDPTDDFRKFEVEISYGAIRTIAANLMDADCFHRPQADGSATATGVVKP